MRQDLLILLLYTFIKQSFQTNFDIINNKEFIKTTVQEFVSTTAHKFHEFSDFDPELLQESSKVSQAFHEIFLSELDTDFDSKSIKSDDQLDSFTETSINIRTNSSAVEFRPIIRMKPHSTTSQERVNVSIMQASDQEDNEDYGDNVESVSFTFWSEFCMDLSKIITLSRGNSLLKKLRRGF